MGQKAVADFKIASALHGLFAVAENYPQLKADQGFLRLQDELAGTENRIATARNDYNQNYSAPAVQQAPQPAKPNYVGIGVGAVVGGLLGNQVGGGNGKKLATVAGVIGGGFLGNEIANRNR